MLSVAAMIPAVEEAAGIMIYLSLYLSYTFRKLLSQIRYELLPILATARVAIVLVTIVAGLATPTTSDLAGDTQTTQSFRDSAVAVISAATVA